MADQGARRGPARGWRDPEHGAHPARRAGQVPSAPARCPAWSRPAPAAGHAVSSRQAEGWPEDADRARASRAPAARRPVRARPAARAEPGRCAVRCAARAEPGRCAVRCAVRWRALAARAAALGPLVVPGTQTGAGTQSGAGRQAGPGNQAGPGCQASSALPAASWPEAEHCEPRAGGRPRSARIRSTGNLSSARARLRPGSGSSRSRRRRSSRPRPATCRDRTCQNAASARRAVVRSDDWSRTRCRRKAWRDPDRTRWQLGHESWTSVRCCRRQLRATADPAGPAAIPMSYRLLLPRLMRRLCPMGSGPIVRHARA